MKKTLITRSWTELDRWRAGDNCFINQAQYSVKTFLGYCRSAIDKICCFIAAAAAWASYDEEDCSIKSCDCYRVVVLNQWLRMHMFLSVPLDDADGLLPVLH